MGAPVNGPWCGATERTEREPFSSEKEENGFVIFG